MKKIIAFIAIIAVVIIAITYASTNKAPQTPAQLTDIRIGWQIPWATQGQLTQALKHTDVLEKNGLKGDFKGFEYGGPLNEAALAGEVDVLFTADQPAAILMSKNSDWKVIGRLMYNRVSLYVPPQSPIKTVAELKGKTVAMPFGAAAQRMALKAEQDAGLDPKKDVNNINLGMLEQNDLVKDVNAAKWDTIDAMAGFDPIPAVFEEKGLIRNLATGKIVSLIVMNGKYIEQHPEAPVQFLKAFRSAYDHYRLNTEQANAWFVEEAKLGITPGALAIASAIEPNVSAASAADIYLDFTDEDHVIMQEAADFLLNQGILKSPFVMKDHIDLSYLAKALK